VCPRSVLRRQLVVSLSVTHPPVDRRASDALRGKTERFDGRPIRELVAGPNIETWADPTNDEVARYEDDSGAVLTYRWLDAPAAARAHLTITIPAAYTKLPSNCAIAVGSATPPGLGSGDPCSS
jgi:hypothetical protein